MRTLSFEELKPGREYIAIDKDRRKYNASCTDIDGEKIVFCCYPYYAADGTKNDLIAFIEKED